MHTLSGANLAHTQRHLLAEGPIFNEQDGNFYYVDIDGNQLCQYDPNTKELKSWSAPKKVCGVAVNQDGSLIVTMQDGLFYFKPDNTGTQWLKINDIESDHPENRPNDATTVQCSDGKTRLFLGTMPLKNQPLPDGTRTGALYVLSDDMQWVKLQGDLLTTNGLAGFTHDKETTLFFSDSHPTRQRIYKANYGCRTQELQNTEEFLDMSQMSGRPDGGGLLQVRQQDGSMKLCYGITAIDTNQIKVFDPDTKEQLATLQLSIFSKKYACRGESLRTRFNRQLTES